MFRGSRSFWKDTSGSILPLAALTATIAIGFAALSADVGLAYRYQAELQKAADAAALAAVTALPDEDAALALALELSAKNMPTDVYGTVLLAADVEFGSWDAGTLTFTAGTSPAKSVRVTTRKAASNGNPFNWNLARVFGMTTSDISRSAVAGKSGSPCVLTLDPSSEYSIELDSNSEINANCGVYANSSDSNAISAKSNSEVNSTETCVVGGYTGGNIRYTPNPTTGCPVSPDPFSSIAPPTFGSCNHNDLEIDTSSKTLYPGVYCGGIMIKNNTKVTFKPGVYIIKNGEFKVDSNAEATGTGVGFYFTGKDARIYFDSNTEIDFTAPGEGKPMAGIIFFEDRNQSLLIKHELNSNNIGRLEGGIYLSRGYLYIDSNTTIGANSKFMTVVARRIKIDSNATLVVNSDYASSSVPNHGAGSGTCIKSWR